MMDAVTKCLIQCLDDDAECRMHFCLNECDMISCCGSYIVHHGLGYYYDDFVLDRNFYLGAMATEAYSQR
jgi:hypothetical protein